MKNKALLMLENGYYDYGEYFSGGGEVFGEFVFNTAMTGYEEIITDPSYKGQIINFTYPLIGNYGVSKLNLQSNKIQANAIIINEISSIYSNHLARLSFKEFLEYFNVIGIYKIDTRALTKQIRIYGAIQGGITNINISPDEFLLKIKSQPNISEIELYKDVINHNIEKIEGNQQNNIKLLAIDFGIKKNIIRDLQKYYNTIYLVPFNDNFSEYIKNLEFDAVFLSNGPGDPRIVKNIDNIIIDFVKENYPIIGICFGHQLIGKAFNLEIEKLSFGHHGGNHPVKELSSGKVFITSQNHNYAISMKSLQSNPDWELTWLHLYDNTVSGIKHKYLPIYSVQFHPEASPGPNDANKFIFDCFFNTVKNNA